MTTLTAICSPASNEQANDEKRISLLFRYAFGVTLAVLALIGALLVVA